MILLSYLLILPLSYAMGSIPFGVVLAKWFGLPDPRTIGSGNIGATNMLRTGNKKIALLTLVLDGGKGALAVVLASMFSTSAPLLSAALAAAALGHMVSPWLKFRGGKGVATLMGGALALSWPVGFSAAMLWLLICLMTRLVSAASVVMLAAFPWFVWLRMGEDAAYPLMVACTVAIFRHRGNLLRIWKRTEPKVF